MPLTRWTWFALPSVLLFLVASVRPASAELGPLIDQGGGASSNDFATDPPDQGSHQPDMLIDSVQCGFDSDCANNTCGGLVCRSANLARTCVAPGADPEGSDGWCETDAHCKCRAEGATCNAKNHCTFTQPAQLKPSDKGCAVGEGSPTGALFVLLALASVARARRRQSPARASSAA